MKEQKQNRIIIKIGTNSLTNADGLLDENFIKEFTAQLAKLAKAGNQLALVSSGSVRAGMAALHLDKLKSLRETQAAAAVGQGLLMHLYQELFQQHDLLVAQVLLVADDFRVRSRYLNARNTLLTLFEKGVIPIINENDTISAEEIKFGDNDNLAAQVAGLMNARTLIFLTDIDGLRQRDGKKLGERLQEIEKITPEIEALAGGSASLHSKGGMISKINSARIATEGGAHVYIANGRESNILQRILAGEKVASHFHPQTNFRDSRKRWIGMSSAVAGTLTIDSGAGAALLANRRSLLAAGVIDCSGDFNSGDIVRVIDSDGKEIARGLVNYNAEEIGKIKGIHSRLFPQILGYRGDPEVIHRDNLFTFKSRKEGEDAVT